MIMPLSLLAGLSLPFFFWLCYWQGWPLWLGGFLLLLLAWRKEILPNVFNIVSLCAALLGLLSLLFRSTNIILYYPATVSFLFLAGFSLSLCYPPTAIERIARKMMPNLPLEGIRYTRRVTQVWCAFFAINGVIALWTIMQPMKIWLMYNGLLSYCAMGLMFGGEWLIRHKAMPHHHDRF